MDSNMQLLITMSIIILHNCNFSIELIIIEVLRPGNMFYKIYFTFLHDILINTQFLGIINKVFHIFGRIVKAVFSADTVF